MSQITREKLAQATGIIAAEGIDLWLTFVRETSALADPVLPFLIDGGLTWQSALLVHPHGQKIAIVGNFDADPLRESGDWDEVIGYVQGIQEPLLATLERLIPPTIAAPTIAVNYSENDDKADGLTFGMWRLLERYLAGSRFAGCLVSAEPIIRALRGRKTATERAAMRAAIAETDRLFDDIAACARVGTSERAIYAAVHAKMRERGLLPSWDADGDPIVNCGPNSTVGHAPPSHWELAPGHILHVDLGVIRDGYASDLQRCWFVGETIPTEVERAFVAVRDTIRVGFAALRPGIPGHEVDMAARAFLTAAGYPAYQHALGHQVGRVAHDGGGLLGPTWERYGETPFWPVEVGQVYTLELGVSVPGHGLIALEEMVVVTETGCEWLSTPQEQLWLLPT